MKDHIVIEDRSQIVILAQIQKYLTTYQPGTEITEYFNKNTQGHCYGLSLIQAVMRKTGKLAWWNGAIDMVLKWNEKEPNEKLSAGSKNINFIRGPFSDIECKLNTLYFNDQDDVRYVGPKLNDNTQYTINEIDPTKHLNSIVTSFFKQDAITEEQQNQISKIFYTNHLTKTFERLINYISFNQTLRDLQSMLGLEFFDPSDFIKPEGFFNFIQNQEILHPKYFSASSGHLSVSNLEKILDENKIENNICIISKIDHACNLSYENTKWYFYDPNYKTGTAKEFSDKAKLIDEIFHRLRNDISIELTSFESKNKQLKLFQPTNTEIILGQGLNMMAQFSRKTLFNLFQQAKNDISIRKIISKQLISKNRSTHIGYYWVFNFIIGTPTILFELSRIDAAFFNNLARAINNEIHNQVPLELLLKPIYDHEKNSIPAKLYFTKDEIIFLPKLVEFTKDDPIFQTAMNQFLNNLAIEIINDAGIIDAPKIGANNNQNEFSTVTTLAILALKSTNLLNDETYKLLLANSDKAFALHYLPNNNLLTDSTFQFILECDAILLKDFREYSKNGLISQEQMNAIKLLHQNELLTTSTLKLMCTNINSKIINCSYEIYPNVSSILPILEKIQYQQPSEINARDNDESFCPEQISQLIVLDKTVQGVLDLISNLKIVNSGFLFFSKKSYMLSYDDAYQLQILQQQIYDTISSAFNDENSTTDFKNLILKAIEPVQGLYSQAIEFQPVEQNKNKMTDLRSKLNKLILTPNNIIAETKTQLAI